jgi:hypothetical protein
MTLQVLVTILDGGDEEDGDERESGETRRDGGEAREELEDDENCEKEEENQLVCRQQVKLTRRDFRPRSSSPTSLTLLCSSCRRSSSVPPNLRCDREGKEGGKGGKSTTD